MNQDKRPTIIDVARLAHVHPSTASRALRGEGKVRPETVALIRAAAARLGYVPDPVARAFQSGARRPDVVAVVVDGPSFGELSRKAQAFWFSLGMRLMGDLSDHGMWVVQTTAASVESLSQLSVDLFVVLSITQPAALPPGARQIVERGQPTEHAAAAMGHDFAAITRQVCDLLRRRGSRQVALLPLSDHDSISSAAESGYRRWCSAGGWDPIVLEPSGDTEGTRAIAAAAADAGVDGIFCLGGEVQAVFDGIRSTGRSCPDDVQVMAIGNGVLEPLFDPPASAVFLDGDGCGRAIADLAQRVLEGGEFETVDLPWRIVERASTRPVGSQE
ncbi:MAG: LacI family DNA-binding transcriptional regulator [Candidatus Nanopelagicales bacterium]